LAITIDSACVTRLQLWPALLSAVDITAKPRPSATSGLLVSVLPSAVTLGAEPALRSIPQLAPWVISSLWFHCCCGSHGFQRSPGW
jgi:hypothetical protein